MATVNPELRMNFPEVPAHFYRNAKRNWHQRRRRKMVLGLMEGLTGNVLDYGCGYGDLVHAISARHDVIGTDLDPRRVAFAAQEYAPIEFKVCSETGVPFDNETFQIVVSTVVLPFVPDHEAYIREIYRVLKPGGYAVISTTNPKDVRQALRSMTLRGQYPSRLNLIDRTQLRELLQRNGLPVVKAGWFYDEPFASWKNLSDVIVGSIGQLLALMRISSPASYFGFLARK